VNLDGEIVGIPSALVANERYFGQSHFSWARNKSGSPILYSATPAHEILKKWGPMLDGQILPFQGQKSRMSRLQHNAKRILPDSDWTRGREVKEAIGSAKQEASSWVVGVRDSSGKQVSLGTICSSDGTVVTLSSSLPDTPRCQLHDGTIVDCDIIRKDKKLNLAILKIPLAGSNSVRWDNNGAAVGAIVAAPLGDEHSFNVGIVSSSKLAPMNGVAQDYFEIDMCLASESCGGPIVNLDFEAIGISIRSHIYGTYVIPAAQVMNLLDGFPE
ncbi:MAG: S1C family serine protease, partial [Pirellula sp.]